MLILQKARNTISEGQTVTYNVGGKWKKYKKVNGKMKYVGMGEAPGTKKKKLIIKRPEEKKRTPEQERILEKVGIDCKDERALKYVTDQLNIFERAKREDEEKTGDTRNIPDYIKNMKFLSSSTAKYTPNKVGLSMEQIVLHQDEHGIDYLKGLPKEVKEAIKPAYDYYKGQAKKIVEAKKAYKNNRKIEAQQNEIRMEQVEILKDYTDNKWWDIYVDSLRNEMLSKFKAEGNDPSEFNKLEKEYLTLEDKKDKRQQPDDEINDLVEIYGKKSKAVKELKIKVEKDVRPLIEKLSKENDLATLEMPPNSENYNGIIEKIKNEIKDSEMRDSLTPLSQIILDANKRKLGAMQSEEYKNLMKPIWDNKKYQEAKKENDEAYDKWVKAQRKFFEKQKKMKRTTAKNVKTLVKKKPEMEKIFRSLYVSQRLNSMLYAKQKKSKNKITVTPKEAEGVITDADAQRLFAKKRATSYKSEALGKKLLNEFAEKGDETKTFSIKTVTPKELKMIRDKMVKNHDMQQHGGFGFKIHNVFQIGDTSYYKDFKKLEKEIGNTIFSYHGTSFLKASKIARGGFKITKPTTGRMIGDGIYGAEHSSKSLQYMGEAGVTRRPGTRGVLFVCKNALGKVKIITSAEVGEREICNDILNKGYDTILAKKGTGGLKNKEWNSKNPNAFLPIYWIDTELTSRNDPNNELFK